ncbi:MAG TPA: 6-phosphofructokinase [Casimicrobiaceae bacterium]|nr:6-phosphofructokinase [Casimicrobiaceae bacterium]
MPSTTRRNAFYAQSGGVTAVINATAAGVIETARAQRKHIGKVLAGRNGIIGALTEDLIDTSKDSAAAIAGLIHTPAGAFGSCRYKLKGLDESRAQYERLIEVFRAHDIGYFFYNGGNDSADTCLKVSQLSERLDYPLVAVHVPKTVDNDLAVTDNCPGFGSVAKYVATSMREAAFDVASMAKTSTKVFVLEVMGRNAGWITAAVGMAEDAATPIPLVLLFPEIPFDEAKFTAAVEANVKQFGYCCIGVSEGLRNADGKLMAETGTKDAFGHAQLGGVGPLIAGVVRDRLGYKFHWAVADYLQRAARHIASKTDLEHSYAVGKAAVQLAVSGRNAVMPAIIRKSDSPYRWRIEAVPLDKVANVEKKLPADFITADGFGITAKARAYLAPLIRGETYPPFKDGVPRYVRLKNVAVEKKLATEFKV